MMRRIRFWVVAVLLASAPRAAAQERSVEELVQIALESAPEIRAARTAIAAANGRVTQAGLRPNPALTAMQQQLSGGTRETLVGVEWPLDLFRRPSRVASARQALEATGFSVQDRERALAAAVRQQAGRLLAAQRTLDVMNEALAAASRMRQLIDSRVNEGEAPRLDANLAGVEVARLEADQALATAEAEATALELRAVVGLPPDAPLTLRDSLEALVRATPAPEPASTAAAQVTEADIAARPDLREAAARVALADARVDEARRDGRFDVALSGSFDRMRFGFAQRGFDESGKLVPIDGLFRGVTLGARMTLPVKNRNQGAVAAAEAERDGEQEMLVARERYARAELEAAVARDRAARRAVEIYATTARDLARQNVNVQLEAYDLGSTPLSDLLAEQRRYLDAEAAYTAVLARAYDTRVALRRARGEIR